MNQSPQGRTYSSAPARRLAVGAAMVCLLLATGGAGGSLAVGARARGQGPRGSSSMRFVDVSATAGVAYLHRLDSETFRPPIEASAGVAAGDVDGDGWVDLVLVRGEAGAPLLLRNRRDGSFEPVDVGLEGVSQDAIGPALADFNGDGRLDLVLGALAPEMPRLLLASSGRIGSGNGAGIAFAAAGELSLPEPTHTFSSAFADLDRDGDLDLVMGHWDPDCHQGCGGNHIWLNDGTGSFQAATGALVLPDYGQQDLTFTPNFADIDGDSWPDLLIASDAGTSRVFHNEHGGGFRDVTDREVITDRSGMGSAVGDYDNDGDLDWFVTAIADGTSTGGNRLYRNRGDGTFQDVTTHARVRDGGWGWGACFADFDNDGDLDLFHVNGWRDNQDRSRLFINQGNGRFRERARRYGLRDRRSGRGVVCFDYDRDGDIDLFVSNHGGASRLYRNDGGNARNYLGVRLRGTRSNRQGVGARVLVNAAGMRQMRELRCGSNYLSQDPVEAHFGLGKATSARVTVVWPDGRVQRLGKVLANQWIEVRRR